MLRRVRVWVVLVALGLVAGVLSVQPASAQASSAPSSGRTVDPQDVPPLVSAKRDLAGELNTPAAGVDTDGRATRPDPDDTKPIDEVVGLRSEGSETYTTKSTMKVTKFFAEPRWYKDPAGGWRRVNNNVVADSSRPGVLKNTGAAWSTTFDVAGSGVDVQVGGQDVRLHIVGDPTVAPVKDPKDSTVVWYRGIRPGVDLKYQISATGIEESYVVSTRAALAAGGFASGLESVGGLVPDATDAASRDFDWDGNGKSAFDGDTDGPKVRIANPIVVDSAGAPVVPRRRPGCVGHRYGVEGRPDATHTSGGRERRSHRGGDIRPIRSSR